jgi:hypothetical protein
VSAPADVSSGGVQTVELSAEDEAGNSATASCAYIVAYEFGSFLSPLGATHKAGSTVPLRFALTDANGVAIPDAEAQALAAACGVRIFFSGGDPSPNCASYNAGSNRFQLNLKLPAASSGVQTITVKVFDGLVLLNESSTSVVLT